MRDLNKTIPSPNGITKKKTEGSKPQLSSYFKCFFLNLRNPKFINVLASNSTQKQLLDLNQAALVLPSPNMKNYM